MDTNYAELDAVIARTRAILSELNIETEDERVETLMSNFYSRPSEVTKARVKAAIRRVNSTVYTSGY